jgi:uncharacterized protein (DUF58 family)
VLLGLAVLSQLSGWLTGDAHVQLAAALLTAPLVVDLLLKPRTLQSVRVVASLRRAIAGAPCRERVELTQGNRRALREITVAQPMRGHGGFVDILPQGTPVTLEIPSLFRERGVLPTRELEIGTSWPFGLVRAQATVSIALPLVVEPARVRIAPSDLAAATHPGAESDGMRNLQGDEFAGLRELHVGEYARGVHALRSAALGQLVRTIRRGRMPQQLALVVDLRLPREGTARTHSRRFEQSLSVAASMLDQVRRHGAAIHVTLLGERVVQVEVDSNRSAWEAFDLLAAAQPSPHHAIDTATAAGLRHWSPCWWTTCDPDGVPGELATLTIEAHVLGKGV